MVNTIWGIREPFEGRISNKVALFHKVARMKWMTTFTRIVLNITSAKIELLVSMIGLAIRLLALTS